MSSVVDNRSTVEARRRHDAQASRHALLDAATELFDDRGYDATTVRDIGERAGVDAALIARYFGGKEGLYLATLTERERPPLPSDPREALEVMLTRSDEQRVCFLPLAMVSSALTPSVRDQSIDVVRTRAVEPLAAELERRGVADAQLRAEALVALATGVSLTRASGTLPSIASASLPELLAVLGSMVDALQEPEG